MPECAENLILEHLAPMRAASCGTAVDCVEQRLDDTTIRIGYLEASFAREQSI